MFLNFPSNNELATYMHIIVLALCGLIHAITKFPISITIVNHVALISLYSITYLNKLYVITILIFITHMVYVVNI